MADIVSYDKQILYSKNGPLDYGQSPVDTVDDLSDMTKVSRSRRYIGLTITVLNTSTTKIPVEYWLVGGILNSNWKIKNSNTVGTYAELAAISPKFCKLGYEMVVQSDENNDGKPSKYWVTAVTSDSVTWERKEYSVSVDGEDVEKE